MRSITNSLALLRKVFLGTTLLTLGLIGTALGLASCETLDPIPERQCGNRVVEPDDGEACDEGPDSTRCGLPSEVGACRFVCDSDNDGKCPDGFGCGLDKICRLSGGLSDSPISIAGGGTQRLMTGDFDGDDRQDVVAISVGSLDVHFLTTDGYIDRSVTLPNYQGIPGVGDVNGDKRADLVLTLGHSMGVLLGQEERSFMSQTYTTMFVAPKTQRLVPLGAFLADGAMLAFSEKDGNTALDLVLLDPEGGHLRGPAGSSDLPGTLVGAVATLGLDIGGKDCGAMAFELKGKLPMSDRVVLGFRCDDDTINNETRTIVGAPWGGAYFADVDDDGDQDLLFGAQDVVPSIQKLLYDSATQKFDMTALPFLEADPGTCISGTTWLNLESAPLAVGDINYDGYPDFVDEAGILIYHPNYPFRICNANAKPTMDPNPQQDPQGWAHAVMGDFNGDGLQDILASRKNEGVLDLWYLQPDGNFNTQTIFVGGVVEELVAGDFDGDLISDAAFRFKPLMMGMGPAQDPLFAIFGNPLALPSSPQLLGFVDNAQHLVAGRIRGTNLLDFPDPISDLVVLSAPKDFTDPMPLTLIQGNVTRNLVSPLSLKQNTTEAYAGVEDIVYGVAISEFGAAACDKFGSDPNASPDAGAGLTPSNIVALGSTGKIWLAGCKTDGSSLSVLNEKIDLGDISFLFAPVDRESTDDALAVFMRKLGGLGFGLIEYEGQDDLGQEQFTQLRKEDLEAINASISLPRVDAPEVPFAFVDIDNNERRDVILTGNEMGQRKVFVFWNGNAKDQSGTMSATAFTEFDFTPKIDEDAGPPDNSPIVDITALDIDGDDYKELAILTNNNVYLAKLKFRTDGTERYFEMLNDAKPFTSVRGGQALLAIDANSDGIEDLIVADTGKLLLYVGKEQFRTEEQSK